MKRLLLPVGVCVLVLSACGAGAGSTPQTTRTAAGTPQARLPAGVRAIDIQAGSVSRHVIGPRKVAQIVTWFNGLRVARSGRHGVCPLVIVGPTVTFDFRSSDGALLARARAPSGVSGRCNPIAFTSGGHRQRPLIGRDFVARVERLLDVRFGPVAMQP